MGANDDLYRRAFETLDTGLCLIRFEDPDDPRGLRIVDINPAMGRNAGYDPSPFVGRLAVEVTPDTLAPGGLGLIEHEVARTGVRRDLGIIPYKSARVAPVNIRLSIVPLAPDAVAVHYENVTAAEVLRKRRDAIFQAAPVSIWEEDLTAVVERIEAARAQDAPDDWDAWFREHPEVVQECAALVRVVEVNAETLRMFGAASAEELAANLAATFLPESLEVFRQELVALARGETRFAAEAPLRTLDGGLRDVVMGLTILGTPPDYRHTVVTFTDVTALKTAERGVEARAAALARANEELERFAYLASHDIQEPLGMVASFCGLLADTYGDRLDDQGAATWIGRWTARAG